MVDNENRLDDDGFTMIEVIIAMMVFALIFIGVGASAATAARMTGDMRARETATNLAAGAIDAARAVPDAFDVVGDQTTSAVDGTAYTVKTTVGWTSASGASSTCGTAGSPIQYKAVHVEVDWPSSLPGSVVTSDTILAPATRLNDPTLGSILVSVLAADGTGSAGVAVTITATSGGGGKALTQQPDATDSDGCSYAFLVQPGVYTVAISRSGYVDAGQNTSASTTVTVAKAQATSAAFQYDKAATFTMKYAGNLSAVTPTPILPSNLTTTFFSTYGSKQVTGIPSSIKLHPFPSGYEAVAGAYLPVIGTSPSCTSVDPGAWLAGTVNGKNLAEGARSDAAAADPGGTAAITVPMAQVAVTGNNTTAMRVTATPTTLAAGDPGCATGISYSFAVPKTGAFNLAVPYGSWLLEEQVGSTWTAVPQSRITTPGNAAGAITDGTVFTVDPRTVAP